MEYARGEVYKMSYNGGPEFFAVVYPERDYTLYVYLAMMEGSSGEKIWIMQVREIPRWTDSGLVATKIGSIVGVVLERPYVDDNTIREILSELMESGGSPRVKMR